jgi:hypothetical protein
LGIDVDQPLSPSLAEKITYAGVVLQSFPQASKAIEKLLEINIGTKCVERFTERIGGERVAQRNESVEAYQSLTLTERLDQGPPGVTPPASCAVMADGGRHQQVESNPDSKNHWFEYKTGICLELEDTASQTDPMPEVPQFLLNEPHVKKLTVEIGKKAADSVSDIGNTTSFQGLSGTETKPDVVAPMAEACAADKAACNQQLSPPVIRREVVATQQNSRLLGLILVAQAWSLGFFQASRKGFVGDGSNWIWTTYEEHFKPAGFTPILDLIHAVTYVYASATAGNSAQEGWTTYRRWVTWIWQGHVSKVLEELRARELQLGRPEQGESETSPRSIVSRALTYLENQSSRMNYPEYRKQGLPITSAHMESTVKEMNRRIKGSEKFWSEKNAEAILQLKADTLCDSRPLDHFWEKRRQNRTGFYSCVGSREAKPTPA